VGAVADLNKATLLERANDSQRLMHHQEDQFRTSERKFEVLKLFCDADGMNASEIKDAYGFPSQNPQIKTKAREIEGFLLRQKTEIMTVVIDCEIREFKKVNIVQLT
jgi:hypothetical protein